MYHSDIEITQIVEYRANKVAIIQQSFGATVACLIAVLEVVGSNPPSS